MGFSSHRNRLLEFTRTGYGRISGQMAKYAETLETERNRLLTKISKEGEIETRSVT